MRRLILPLLAFPLLGAASPQSLAVAKQQAIAAERRAAALQQQAAGASSAAARARAEAEALAARIEASEADLTAAQTRIALIARLQAAARARLAERQAPIAQLTAALQTMTRRPPALALAQPGSLDDMVRVRALLASALPEVRRRTASIREELARVDRLRAQAEQARAALDDSRAALRQRRVALAQLETQQRSRAGSIQTLAFAEADRALVLTEEARSLAEASATRAAQAQIAAVLASLGPPLPRPGAPAPAPPPVADRPLYRLPVQGRVVTGVGEISEAGVHARGTTFEVAPNARIIAPATGRVVFAGPYRSYGNLVIVDHGGGWTSVLTNIGQLEVRRGSLVQAGTALGRSAARPSQITVELRRGLAAVPITQILPG